jgi:tetratricopeptide (TPR) repeat protein
MPKNVQWGQIIFSVVGTAILIFIGNLVYYKLTNKKPSLVYEIAPPSSYISEKMKIQIYTGLVENNGNDIAENVVATFSLPEKAILQDKQFVPTDKTIKYDVTQPDSHSIELNISKGLNPLQGIRFSFLLQGETVDKINVALSGKGLVGKSRELTKKDSSNIEDKDSLRMTVIIQFLIMSIVIMIIGFVMMMAARMPFLQSRRPSRILHVAVEYFNLDMLDEAILAFNKGVDDNPDDADVRSRLAIAYAKKGLYDRAITECKLAERLSPKAWFVYISFAAVYAYQNDYDKTAEYIKKALSIGGRKKIVKYITEEPEFGQFRQSDKYSELLRQ